MTGPASARFDSADWFVFSGTGNTLRAARAAAGELAAAGIRVRLRSMDRGFAPPEGDPERSLLGIACAVAVFSTYPCVWEFLEALPPGGGRPAALLDTLGGFSGGLVGPVRDLLERKGYRPLGACEIRMPSNYRRRAEGPDEEERRTIARGEERARAFARALLEGGADWRGFPLGGPIHWLSRRPGLWRRIGESSANAWRADPDLCTRCGLCASLCPTGNIDFEGGAVRGGFGSRAFPGPDFPRPEEPGPSDGAPGAAAPDPQIGRPHRLASLPVWGRRCCMCQRCFAFCPVGAVAVPGRAWGRYRPEAGPVVGVEEVLEGR